MVYEIKDLKTNELHYVGSYEDIVSITDVGYAYLINVAAKELATGDKVLLPKFKNKISVEPTHSVQRI